MLRDNVIAQESENKTSMHEWLITDTKVFEQLHPLHPMPAALLFPEKMLPTDIDVFTYDVSMDWVSALLTNAADRPARKTVGRVKMRLRVTNQFADTLYFHSEKQEIDSVSIGSVVVPFTLHSGKIRIPVTSTQATADTLNVTIWYANLGDNKGFYAFSRADAEAQNLPEAIAFTFSQPENARFWFPCNDVPSDKAVFTGSVRVPRGFTVVSNGQRVSTILDTDSTQIESWHHPLPMPSYLFCLNASKFTTFNQVYHRNATDSVPIFNYHWAVDDTGRAYNAQNALATIPDMFKAFEKIYGPYPFPTYGHVTVAPIQFGGMEHQSMSTINRRWLIGDVELGYAHELAHQWLGDEVTCATWGDIWLNEGGATFSEATYAEYKNGIGGYNNVMASRRAKYMEKGLAEPPVYNIPLATIFNEATTYAKSGWVYHMMRFHVGDSLFFATLRKYIQRYSLSSVQTSQMLEMWKEEMPNAPVPWDTFFEQWLVKAGHPVLVASVAANSIANTTGQYRNTVTIQQTQVHSGVPEVFVFPLTIRLVRGASIQDFNVQINSRSSTFYFETPFEVDSVLLDPRRQILCEKQGSVTTDVPESVSDSPIRIIGAVPNVNGSSLHLMAPIGSEISIHDMNGSLISTAKSFDMITPIVLDTMCNGVLLITVRYGAELKRFSVPVIR